MNSTSIKHNVQSLIDSFSNEECAFDLLVAYGISKTALTCQDFRQTAEVIKYIIQEELRK